MRNIDRYARRSGKAGALEFVDLRRRFDSGDIHGFGQRFGHKIDDKFTGSADVVEGVFRVSINCADAGTEQDGGRSGADGVEKAERREVRLAGGVNGADPG